MVGARHCPIGVIGTDHQAGKVKGIGRSFPSRPYVEGLLRPDLAIELGVASKLGIIYRTTHRTLPARRGLNGAVGDEQNRVDVPVFLQTDGSLEDTLVVTFSEDDTSPSALGTLSELLEESHGSSAGELGFQAFEDGR
jgi:hypothetical protein